MKRILLFATAILSFSLAGFGQNNIDITRQGAAGNHSVNDSTITINASLPTSLVFIPLNVINTGASSITLRVKRYEIDTLSSASNYLCWGLCYGSQYAVEWTAPSTQTLTVNDTNTTFTADLSPNSAGTEEIRYTFFSSVNVNDSASVLIKWIIAPQGVNEVAANNLHISAPYPNPANSVTNFNYHLNGAEQAKLEVYNTVGQCVENMAVNASADKLSLNVNTLPAGIYICKLIANGSQPVFQKLIVTH